MLNAKGFVHKYGDNVDTDVIIPARYLNIADKKELATHCMEDIDKDFVKNVKPGDIIVAEENFGCGSSREHAPVAIKAAGVSCVIAKSFARIHKANLINNAIIPMTFANPADYDDFNLGDVLSFSDLPAQIKARKVTVKNETTGKTYELNLELGERQERLLLEGGLLTSIKHGK